MFNHIYVKHPGYFQEMTTKQWLLEAQSGKPLKVCWNKMNDFDEEETVTIFGCLATKKTFQTEYKAQAHFAKHPDALKEHNKDIKLKIKARKELLKLNSIETKKEKKKTYVIDPKYEEYKILKSTNDPVLLKQLTDYIDAQMKDATVLYNSTQHLTNFYTPLLGKSVSEIHSDFDKIKITWPTIDKSVYKHLSTVNALKDVIYGLEFIDGGSNPESNARTFVSDWSEYF
jgi:hypothetical protein